MLLHFIVVCRISLQISDAQLPYLKVWTGEIEVKYMDHCSILILFFFSHYVVEFCCCGLHHCFGQTCHADGFTFDFRILWYQEEHNNCKVSKSCGCKTNQTHQPSTTVVDSWYLCCADFLCSVHYGQISTLFQKSRGLFR